MKVIKLDEQNNIEFKYCSYTEMGNILEVQKMTNKNIGTVLRKINKDIYVDLRTGEAKEYKHITKRSDDTSSIRKSMNRLRGYINTNVINPKNCKWVTFTYSENMQDVKQLYLDYNKFFKRLTYQLQKRGLEVPQYISVIEPQGRGAWHIHAFFIFKAPAPYIPKNLDVVVYQKLQDTFNLADTWKHGFVDIQNVKNCDNIGAYFTAYLTDIPLDDVEILPFQKYEVVEKTYNDNEDKQVTKKFVKGERLKLYPPGMNLYRCSKGIIKPEKVLCTAYDIDKKVSGAIETFSSTFSVIDDNDNDRIINTISKKQYKFYTTDNKTITNEVLKNA